ncbi:hypothetical protein AVEN_124119-1 [Araneus ventricosus]|uniref:Uncharacterized protein n=1 Tax=Araneus ventricosus TaxID=182803 RepID=A0A4Y2HXB4_ARAVE|nr:hypothetical protein AVEN_124119-1 [Araneus ventricosus]
MKIVDFSSLKFETKFINQSLRSILAHVNTVTEKRSELDGCNGPYAPFGFESIEKQLWRNKQNDRPISDSEIKAVQNHLFKTDQWLPPAGHVSEDVTSHPYGPFGV